MNTDRELNPTRSLCPECLEEIDGQLFLQDGRVMIRKECPRHGAFSGMVDPDAPLYLRCAAPRGRPRTPYATLIPISMRCNLSCAWCYLPDRGKECEPSLEAILQTVADCGTRFTAFAGGEPTLREDLPELIREVKRRFPDKIPTVATNGLKLADPVYLAELQAAGLECCVFSLNGFRPSTHVHFNGRDISREKELALANLKRAKVPTVLSMTMAKGLNDDEFPAVFDYAVRNLDFVRQVRLRNVSEVGTHVKHPHLYLTDMIRLVAAGAGLSLEEACLVNESAARHLKTGNHFIVSVFTALEQRAKRQAWEESGRRGLPTELAARSRELFRQSVRDLAGTEAAHELEQDPGSGYLSKKEFLVEIFSWPTPGNIDLTESRRLSVSHVTMTGEILSFWDALFYNDRLRLRGESPFSARL